MSEPQQPSVPPYAQPNHTYPAAAPAQPQAYPAAAGATPYPAQAPYARPEDSTENATARAAFIVALITLGIGLLTTLMLPLIHLSSGFDSLTTQLLSLASGVVALIGGAAALILGIVAARRPGAPVKAGIAIGIGAAGLLGLVFSWLSTLLYSFHGWF